MKSPMSEVLDEMADYFLETDIADEEWTMPSYLIDYTDRNVMAAVCIFNSILWNRHSKSDKASVERAQKFWEELHKLILEYTGVNTKTFYNKK